MMTAFICERTTYC